MDYLLSPPRLLPNSYCLAVYSASLALLCVVFYALSPFLAIEARSSLRALPPGQTQYRKPATATTASLDHKAAQDQRKKWKDQICKKRAWILTGTAALVMTVCSVPFLVDLAREGGDVAKVHRREWLAQGVTSFFLAYLNLDLVLGMLHYPKQVTLLTGWIHHSAYTILLLFLLHHNICHAFALAAVMELPTFVLSLSMLVPATRSDSLFTGLFFITRILFHVVLLGLYFSHHGRTFGSGLFQLDGTPVPTWLPAIGLSLAAPLHITWFHSSVRGMIRRRRAAAAAAVAAPPSPLLLPIRRPRLVSLASSYLSSPRPQLLRSSSIPFSPSPNSALSPSAPLRNPTGRAFDRIVRDYFAERRQAARSWMERDENDVLKAQVFPRTVTRLRMRAGKGGDELRRIVGERFGAAGAGRTARA